MNSSAINDPEHSKKKVADTRLGRVLFVGSSGGHLAQLLPLRDLFHHDDRSWVTFPTTDATGALSEESDVVWASYPTTRNLPNLLRNTLQAWHLMRSRRPDVVISTGAAVALPYFILSRFFGARTAYIEVYDRVDSPTLTARLCSPFTDLFAVQWDEQRRLYRDTVTIGPLL
ncbi:hypothetical protein [Microbacterium sp. RU33B]|uniref:hypothetical protein n=1 Tax=Microbacterium sp. RU33B TaxID=1907390 RepID=UPI00095DDECE|nr:hypothetical protein [Microbacterium sp. RU33B]SIT84214.1 Oligosaccharide biosynthesis protein Alg14 like [Microbacterium sp. RU33B]